MPNKKIKNNDTKDTGLQTRKVRGLKKIKQMLLKETNQLPIYKHRESLQDRLKSVDKLIVVGESGIGKSTQIPKYVYEANLNNHKCIAVTQPRRVAAITLATRVAAEMGSKLGDTVGYNVRFDCMSDENTKIIFMTDKILLKEAMADPQFQRYGMIILDEAHERTVETDVLFGLVKKAYHIRNASEENIPPNKKSREQTTDESLKVVVMSATLDTKQFSDYFDGADVMQIPGRQHHIEILYESSSFCSHFSTCLENVTKIHEKAPINEGILVFWTGQQQVNKAMRKMTDSENHTASNLLLLPFHSSLPMELQMKVFEPAPTGLRKVVFSTNLAETSLTIPGIRHVIDSGECKNRTYDVVSGLDYSEVKRVSQAQANQRSGRAGREAPGVCYRSYSKKDFDSFHLMPLPEIKRRNLAGVILQLVNMGINDILSFDFMDKPSPESVEKGIRMLKWLNAVKQENNLLELTDDGSKMVGFPLDPRFSKVILEANSCHRLSEALTVISLLSAGPIFGNPTEDENLELWDVKRDFGSQKGDLIMYLNLYRRFSMTTNRMRSKCLAMKQWCEKKKINHHAILRSEAICNHLRVLCKILGFDLNEELDHDSEYIQLRKSFFSGFFMNSAVWTWDSLYVSIWDHETYYQSHPSSYFWKGQRPRTVFYIDLDDNEDRTMRVVTGICYTWLKKLKISELPLEPLKALEFDEFNRTWARPGGKDSFFKSDDSDSLSSYSSDKDFYW